MLHEHKLDIDVVTAARRRIENVFANGLPVYLSFSGGKDSLCLAHVTMELAREGRINLAQLTVQFIDEEAIFPCVDRVVRDWRARFLLAGARFDWYCLEVRHYSCLNAMEQDESFFCWDRTKQAVWVRDPPPFAIRSHPLLKPRVDNYQAFLPRLNNGLNMVGVRADESIQRRLNITMGMEGQKLGVRNTVFPIYDWRDADVWLYLHTHAIAVPDAYMFMYQIGIPRRQLRISQFFSNDTISTLAHIGEYYPHLMDRILAREPNAYIVALYFDSEMFRRRTRTRRELEGGTQKDYRGALLALLANVNANFHTHNTQHIARQYRAQITRYMHVLNETDYRKFYESLIAGDPKRRNLRALSNALMQRYAAHARAA